ncbi:MAG: glycosyltransferase family 2 protein [Erysipelotrichaceae bacterium]|nr:glycosyltransferase family 2 protein [Erysipelotrichaceae bacterium]
MKVSVIVPVWGVEKYLDKCLDSLVHQTIPVKVIVVNDSSPDQSQLIIDRYKESYPDLIDAYIKPNGGIADVRNYGLSKVNTPYFGFLDSDDYAEPDMFEKLLNAIEKEEADVAVSQFYWEYSETNKTLGLDGPYEAGKQMMVSQMATLWNKLYRTDWIGTVPLQFPTGYRYEDAYFLYCLAPFVRKVVFVEEPFVHYVQREGSITHNHNEKVKDMVHVFESILDFYRKNNLYEQYKCELEYLFTKFFLGNSFLRSVQIKEKKLRDETLEMSYRVLFENFPEYMKNSYLKTLPGLKNRYFSLVRKWNYPLFAMVFRVAMKFKS